MKCSQKIKIDTVKLGYNEGPDKLARYNRVDLYIKFLFGTEIFVCYNRVRYNRVLLYFETRFLTYIQDEERVMCTGRARPHQLRDVGKGILERLQRKVCHCGPGVASGRTL